MFGDDDVEKVFVKKNGMTFQAVFENRIGDNGVLLTINVVWKIAFKAYFS